LWPWRQHNPRETGLYLAALHATTGDARLQFAQRDRHPGHEPLAGVGHAVLDPQQPEAHKAHAPLPVGIQLTAQAAEAHGESLQAAHQHVDRHHQEQPIDTLRVAQATALQLEDPRFLVAEQLLSAEPPGVTPDQIQCGIGVADQWDETRSFAPLLRVVSVIQAWIPDAGSASGN